MSTSKINFYHLTSSPLEKALPRLLQKIHERGHRVLVKARDLTRVESLDKEMWTYTTKYFLPHGTRSDGFAERQPIYLTAKDDDVPNDPSILVVVDDANMGEKTDIESYERCVYMFEGHNQELLSKARSRWKSLKEEGFDLVYWQQDNKGGWQQKSKN